MFTKNAKTKTQIGSTILNTEPTPKQKLKDYFQKSLVSLKADWSAEYIHWTGILSAFTNLSTSPSIKNNLKQASLKKQVWEMQSMMNKDFKLIEEEIDACLTEAHHGRFEHEGYELGERFWQLHSEIAFFRQKVRSLEINFLTEVYQQLPIAIY